MYNTQMGTSGMQIQGGVHRAVGHWSFSDHFPKNDQ